LKKYCLPCENSYEAFVIHKPRVDLQIRANHYRKFVEV
jgi:hypothetical protein